VHIAREGPSEAELGRRLDEHCARLGEHFEGRDVELLLQALRAGGQAIIRQPPLAAQALLTLLNRRSYGMDEVIRLIERDPALSQALLRHANSAWYASSFGAPVISIRGAVQRVGTKGVHAMVMAQVVQGGLSRPGAGFNEMATMVWNHMVRTAPIARRLARVLGGGAEDAYTLGLLHDVGKLVLFDRIADLRRRERRNLDLPSGFVRIALREVHETLGGIAALQWRLADEAVRVISGHHRTPPPEGFDPLGEAVFLAEKIDIAAQRGEELDLEQLWADGGLQGPRERVETFLAAERARENEAEAEAERADGGPGQGAAAGAAQAQDRTAQATG